MYFFNFMAICRCEVDNLTDQKSRRLVDEENNVRSYYYKVKFALTEHFYI